MARAEHRLTGLLIALWIVVEGLSAFFSNKTLEAKAQA